nr:hypothetical protein GCM10020241_62290 [Streptoalloteichus tenebrarius]
MPVAYRQAEDQHTRDDRAQPEHDGGHARAGETAENPGERGSADLAVAILTGPGGPVLHAERALVLHLRPELRSSPALEGRCCPACPAGTGFSMR